MKRVRDPIHDYIQLSQTELTLVDTPLFQRLRGIRQLGLAYLVYPGANHTRFEHSLGTCHLARELARASGLAEEEVVLAGLAGLLHDIGHGPFSHLGEEVSGLQAHEAVSAAVLRKGLMAEALEGLGVDPEEVARVILGRHRLSPLITSELDADRMDYLVRDAYYCGVRTGADLGRLAATLRLEEGQLQVFQNGLAAVEALLVARHTMYPIVYFHPTARAGELLVSRAVSLALANGDLTADRFHSLEDASLLALLAGLGGWPARAIIALRGRRLPKAVVELGLDRLEQGLVEGLAAPGARAALERELAEQVGLEPADIWVDLPPLQDRTATFKLQVVEGAGGRVRPLVEASTLAASLYQAQFDHWRLRVYGPRKERERWNRLARAARGRLAA